MTYLVHINERLGRANEHIEAVQTMLRAYYGGDPYSVSGEFDPQTGAPPQYTFGRAPDPIPIAISTRAGEALHNLRSALDHLAWQLVIANGGTPDPHTTFPILKVPPTANKKGIHPPPHVSGGVSKVASALIANAQPYTLGIDATGHPLWILRQLNDLDKHRHITVRGARFEGIVISDQLPRFTFTMRTSAVSEWGAEVRYIPDDPAVDVNISTTLQIMVHEIDSGINISLLEALHYCREGVVTVVRAAEETCFS